MFAREDIKISVFWRVIEIVGAEFFAFCSFLVLTACSPRNISAS